jgi:hypothetical protein
MERMGDPKASALSLRIGCIRQRCPRAGWNA